jgi:hypothetical protein
VSNLGQRSSGLVKQNVAKEKKLRTQINGKFKDIRSSDENNKISL